MARAALRDALRVASGVAVLVWWAPSILLAVAAALAFAWGVDVRLRRAHRLLDAGRKAEALRVHAAVVRDRGAAKRRARAWRGGR